METKGASSPPPSPPLNPTFCHSRSFGLSCHVSDEGWREERRDGGRKKKKRIHVDSKEQKERQREYRV